MATQLNQQDITDKLINGQDGHRVCAKGGDPLCSDAAAKKASVGRGRYSVSHDTRISAGVGVHYAGICTIQTSIMPWLCHPPFGRKGQAVLDWASIAKASPVIVIYMAMSRSRCADY